MKTGEPVPSYNSAGTQVPTVSPKDSAEVESEDPDEAAATTLEMPSTIANEFKKPSAPEAGEAEGAVSTAEADFTALYLV